MKDREKDIEAELMDEIEAQDWMDAECRAPARRFTQDEIWFLNRCKELERQLEQEQSRTQFYRLQMKYQQRKWWAYKKALVQKLRSLGGALKKLKAEEAVRKEPTLAERMTKEIYEKGS